MTSLLGIDAESQGLQTGTRPLYVPPSTAGHTHAPKEKSDRHVNMADDRRRQACASAKTKTRQASVDSTPPSDRGLGLWCALLQDWRSRSANILGGVEAGVALPPDPPLRGAAAQSKRNAHHRETIIPPQGQGGPAPPTRPRRGAEAIIRGPGLETPRRHTHRRPSRTPPPSPAPPSRPSCSRVFRLTSPRRTFARPPYNGEQQPRKHLQSATSSPP